MFQSHQGKYSSSATYAADKQFSSHNALHRQRLAFRDLHGQSHEARFLRGLGRCLFVEWLGRDKFWHQAELFVCIPDSFHYKVIDLQKLGQLSVSTSFWMEMCFPPIALWQNMMPLQLLKEAGFSSFSGSFNFQPHIQTGWYCINIWDEKKMVIFCHPKSWKIALNNGGLSWLSTSAGHYSHESWVHICAAAVPSCSAENKTCWHHRGRIGMMGTIFTNVKDYPPEVLQNGWLEDYFPIGKVPFEGRTVKLRECNFYREFR